MSEKKWTAVGKENATDVLSERGLLGCELSIELGTLALEGGFCDCEYADTWWDILLAEQQEDGFHLVIVDATGEEETLIYA